MTQVCELVISYDSIVTQAFLHMSTIQSLISWFMKWKCGVHSQVSSQSYDCLCPCCKIGLTFILMNILNNQEPYIGSSCPVKAFLWDLSLNAPFMIWAWTRCMVRNLVNIVWRRNACMGGSLADWTQDRNRDWALHLKMEWDLNKVNWAHAACPVFDKGTCNYFFEALGVGDGEKEGCLVSLLTKLFCLGLN